MRLGIDFGGTNIKIGIFSEDGKTVKIVEKKLTELTSGSLLENLINLSKGLSSDVQLTGGGFAIKGLVDTESGIVYEDIGAGSLLAGVNLKNAFSDALKVPFNIENDARAYAWGEYKFGAGRGSKCNGLYDTRNRSWLLAWWLTINLTTVLIL
jgi:glucokinase